MTRTTFYRKGSSLGQMPARNVTWTRVLEAWQLDQDSWGFVAQGLRLQPPKHGPCLLRSPLLPF